MSEPLVLEHDPERGCVTCPLSLRDVDSDHSVHFWCDADFHARGAEASRLGHAVRPAKRVSRHPAPDWCPLRTAPVLIRTPGGES